MFIFAPLVLARPVVSSRYSFLFIFLPCCKPIQQDGLNSLMDSAAAACARQERMKVFAFTFSAVFNRRPM
jgi:hypothetical protein